MKMELYGNNCENIAKRNNLWYDFYERENQKRCKRQNRRNPVTQSYRD